MIAGLFSNYSDYLNSYLWQEKRDYFIEKNRYSDGLLYCQKCGIYEPHYINVLKEKKYQYGGETKVKRYYVKVKVGIPMDIHHKTYERVGNEKSEDLMIVCKKCHAKIHNRVEKRNWKIIKKEDFTK